MDPLEAAARALSARFKETTVVFDEVAAIDAALAEHDAKTPPAAPTADPTPPVTPPVTPPAS